MATNNKYEALRELAERRSWAIPVSSYSWQNMALDASNALEEITSLRATNAVLTQVLGTDRIDALVAALNKTIEATATDAHTKEIAELRRERDRWIGRVKTLERRIEFIEEVCGGDHDD